jgi:hypothetical protein
MDRLEPYPSNSPEKTLVAHPRCNKRLSTVPSMAGNQQTKTAVHARGEKGGLSENTVLNPLHGVQFATHAKGKIERFFRTLQESFFPELSFEPAADLEQLNRRLWHWIENGYHRRAHAALGGKTPLERFGGVRLRPLPQNWQALFYERISRRVRLDATVSLEGQLWEVPVHLRGRAIELRRDPFEQTRIEVWCQGTLCGIATRCRKVLSRTSGAEPPMETSGDKEERAH